MTAAAQSQRRSIDEIFAIYKIQKPKLDANGSGYTTCPNCSLRRKPANRSKPVLRITVNRDSVLGFCNHCTWSFGEFFEHREGRAIFLATYDYRDEVGTVLFQTVRLHPKDFRQRRPDGRGGWIWDLKGVRRVLYRLPELIEAIKSGRKVKIVFIVEGEKDVDRLRALNEVATCNPMGAGKWRDEYAESLRGFEIAVVITDKDDAGRAHAKQVAASVSRIIKTVKVIELPVKDVSDFFAADGTIEELCEIVNAAPKWPPETGQGPDPKPKEPPRPLMRALPPADPFPIDALGDVLGAGALAIHDRVQAPLAIGAQSALAFATLAVQAHADVVLPIGQGVAKPLSSYFVTIALSGERKSECDNQAGWPIKKREQALREKYDADLPGYINSKDAWDRARQIAKNRKKATRASIEAELNEIGPPPTAPLMPMLTCPEPTFEGLCRLFAIGEPSLGLFSAEGGQFIGGHAMNEDNRLKTAAGLSDLWDGKPIRRVRVGEGASVLPGRRLAAHLMTQPDVASILLGDRLLADQGLLSRTLVSAPDTTMGTRPWHDEQSQTDHSLRRYGARLLEILETPLPLSPGKNNELQPRELPLSPEARRRFIAFHDHVEKKMKTGGELEPVRGIANKLPEQAARLAAVLTLVKDIRSPAVAVGEMEAGIALAEHYVSEALRLYEASRVNAELRLAQRLLDWLQRRWAEPVISLPDIYQSSLNAIGDQATARKLVAILEDHGWLEKVRGGAVVAGKRRRDAWLIVRVGG